MRDGAAGGDGDVLLVAVCKEVENRLVEETAQTLMQDKYKVSFRSVVGKLP